MCIHSPKRLNERNSFDLTIYNTRLILLLGENDVKNIGSPREEIANRHNLILLLKGSVNGQDMRDLQALTPSVSLNCTPSLAQGLSKTL
jgi:hypothetical protein